ncbi:MAG: hydroxymethylbilane synthase [Sphingomicrobium sp.]
MNRRLKLGTRGSPLALAQASQAAAAIAAANGWAPDAIDIVTITTTGDTVQDRPLADIGGKALWTKELDRALAEGMVDLCVHSMKDVESVRPASFRLAVILPRADVRDRLIGAASLDDLPLRAVFGTSSPRRAAQVQRVRPDLVVEPIRGNVQTRLAKIDAGEFAATLLAAAGLERLGIEAGAPLPVELILPAPGQAAIGIECRADDWDVGYALEAASDKPSFDCVMAERAFTRALGGTCHSPIAALANFDDFRLHLRARLYSANGDDCMADEAHLLPGDDAVPAELARAMLSRAPPSIQQLFDPV